MEEEKTNCEPSGDQAGAVGSLEVREADDFARIH